MESDAKTPGQDGSPGESKAGSGSGTLVFLDRSLDALDRQRLICQTGALNSTAPSCKNSRKC